MKLIWILCLIIKFQNNEIRQVELVYGEAYFEVSPSTKHNGMLFNVITKNQEVSVLGTEFNIKAYNGDNEIRTTLVGGKFAIKKGGFQNILKPNQQSIIGYDSDVIQVYNVDTSQEVSWVNGLFTFNGMALEDILVILSRWYDTSVFYKSDKQRKINFTGVLERSKSINEILKLIELANQGEVSFKVSNNIIIVK